MPVAFRILHTLTRNRRCANILAHMSTLHRPSSVSGGWFDQPDINVKTGFLEHYVEGNDDCKGEGAKAMSFEVMR